jgi:hypothetical protein
LEEHFLAGGEVLTWRTGGGRLSALALALNGEKGIIIRECLCRTKEDRERMLAALAGRFGAAKADCFFFPGRGRKGRPLGMFRAVDAPGLLFPVRGGLSRKELPYPDKGRPVPWNTGGFEVEDGRCRFLTRRAEARAGTGCRRGVGPPARFTRPEGDREIFPESAPI